MMKSGSFINTGASQYATFFLKDALCGIALNRIQEINKPSDLTAVPQAPDYVMGIINLRGKIVTVIDTGRRLGLSPIRSSKASRIIIVNGGEESIGLMVDGIGNVVTVTHGHADPSPANIGEIPGRCFDGVFKTEDQLVGLLDMESLI